MARISPILTIGTLVYITYKILIASFCCFKNPLILQKKILDTCFDMVIFVVLNLKSIEKNTYSYKVGKNNCSSGSVKNTDILTV